MSIELTRLSASPTTARKEELKKHTSSELTGSVLKLAPRDIAVCFTLLT